MLIYARFFFLLTVALLLVACSSTQYAYYDSLKLALHKADDATLTMSEVQQAEYDLIYVRVDDKPRATMVLAYLEHGQHKWLSGDDVLLVMEQGRIVRTLGFRNDLTFVSNTAADPIRRENRELVQREWSRLTDWQFQHQSGYQLSSVVEEVAGEFVDVLEHTYDTRVLKEVVHFQDSDQHIENLFWFERSTGLLLQSRQQLAPHMPVFTVTYISQAARISQPDQQGSSTQSMDTE
jgi:hypothetical protein